MVEINTSTRQQGKHSLSLEPKHDERARQQLCQAIRSHLLSDVQNGTQVIFNNRVEPVFKKENGRTFKDRHEVRRGMEADPYYRLYSASLRTTQELMWDSIIDTCDHDMPRINSKFNATSGQSSGSLELNPDLEIPRYHSAADIHLQPGGYHTDFTDNDLTAGAIYDRALYLYGDGKFGTNSDVMGQMVCNQVHELRPNFEPSQILDMGCTVGNSTLPFTDAFPESEIYAIDIGAPCLRYGHARAEALGKKVHFAQMNAEKTNYEDESFDLIVSHLLFHETSRSAFTNILRECHRLLSPGGLMVHLDIPQDKHCDDLYRSFLWDWEAYNNNETFEVVLRSLDYETEAVEAGFDRNDVSLGKVPFGWPLLIASKAT